MIRGHTRPNPLKIPRWVSLGEQTPLSTSIPSRVSMKLFPCKGPTSSGLSQPSTFYHSWVPLALILTWLHLTTLLTHRTPQIVLLVLSFAAKESERVFHYLFSFALLVGAITYYAQASDLGWSAVKQTDHLGNGVVRQMFYARYINWVVSFPSLVLGLGLISGVSWTTIFCNIAIAWYWVISYLVSAYTTTAYRWGFFAFGTFSWLILAMSTINESREAAALLGIERDYLFLAGWLNLLWLLYPIAFGLTDGGNMIGVYRGFCLLWCTRPADGTGFDLCCVVFCS